MDDDYWWPASFGSIGSCYDLRDNDPRNPRLIGCKSVSYNAAVALQRAQPPAARIGFHVPRRRT